MKWFERKPLSRKEILAKLKEGCEGEAKVGWCDNSRMYTLFMIFRYASGRPETCTYPQAFKGCDGCHFYEQKKPNYYVLSKLQLLRWGVESEKNV